MKKISNSLTEYLDNQLKTVEDFDHFLDGLEDEILGVSNRDFYMRYKGDIKELLDSIGEEPDDLNYECKLLKAFIEYGNQRSDS